MKNTKKFAGFSLVEMMVVLLIVSVVMAASAPMISKKMIKTADTSPWVWIGNDGTIGHNIGKKDISVIIGATSDGASAGHHPKLFIESNSVCDKPQIQLKNESATNSSANIVFKSNGAVGFSTLTDSTNLSDNGVAIGKMAKATVAGATSIGAHATASGGNAIAIGGSNATSDTTASAVNTIAIGRAATAGQAHGIAIGEYTSATGQNGIAIGQGDTDDNVFAVQRGVAIGSGFTSGGNKFRTMAGGSDSIAIGSGARAYNSVNSGSGQRSIAIGYESEVFRFNSATANGCAIAIGENAHAYRQGSIAIGANSEARTGANRTDTSNHGSGAMAIGQHTRATFQEAVALGSRSTSTGQRNVAVGCNAEASGSQDAIAIGPSAQATGMYSIALGGGEGNKTWTYNLPWWWGGQTITITRDYKASASGTNSIALGTASIASNTYSTAVGFMSKASAENATAVGHGADATANNSIAIGVGTYASHANSTAIGKGATTTAANQIVLGDANTSVYIPGKLYVKGDSYLGIDSSSNTYVRLAAGSSSGRFARLDCDDTDVDWYTWTAPTTFSDRRLKNVGKAFTGGIEQIKKLQVFNYTFKKDEKKTPHVGIIAQDLQKIFPDAVIKGEDGFLRIRTEDIFYALVNAVKELDARITKVAAEVSSNVDLTAKLQKQVLAQEKQIEELRKQNAEFAKRIEKLEKKLK